MAIAYPVVLAINLTNNWGYYASGGDWRPSIFFTLSATTLSWLTYVLFNELFLVKLLKYKGWEYWKQHPFYLFLFIVCISIAFGSVLMTGMMGFMAVFFHWNSSPSDYLMNSTFMVLFTLIFTLMAYGAEFIKQWKISTDDNARMREEMVRGQYELLKTQVNPHFLFNSLNTLSSIIPSKPDVAVLFVQQMARVFRYSLNHISENTVSLAIEMKIVESYIFINKQRYGEKLIVNINITEAALESQIVTQSLLMLVENAIKHNELSEEHPLTMDIYNEGSILVTMNTLQPKKIMEESTGIGLANVVSRYKSVSNIPVVIDKQHDLFIVKMPLL
ncbi:MAG: histidine kinase [Flavipsychrobacter sp.]|nr:histidine kinase [Flavipsychrobacter sp.]